MQSNAPNHLRMAAAALAVACAATVMVSTSPALAAEFKAGAITIEQPWSRATPGGAKVASGFLTIENSGDSGDRLVSVTADIAGRTEIHQMSMIGGVMQMRQLTDGLPIPAKGSVALEPSSYHLMFVDLSKPLQEGETFSGKLTFEKAGTMDVTFEVRGIGAAAPDEGAGHHH
ncbi:MAG: copper chaperone PCu(A)C [Methyloceanibacter sp.]